MSLGHGLAQVARLWFALASVETIRLVYDHLDHQRASGVFLNTIPAASLVVMRRCSAAA